LQQGQPAQLPKLASEKRMDEETMQDFSCLCGLGAGMMASPVGKQRLPAELLHSPMWSVIPLGSLSRSKHLGATLNHSSHLYAYFGTHSNMLTVIIES